VLLWLLVAAPVPLHAEPVTERLVYALTWMGIPVGTAVQEFSEQGNLRRITATAVGNSWLSAFYLVDNRIESVLTREGAPFPGAVRNSKLSIREGGHRREREIVFFPETAMARFRDLLTGEELRIPLLPGTYDIYGSFFFVRNQVLTVGTPVTVNVLDGREPRQVMVQVLRRETLKTVLGTVETIVVRPQVQSEGAFEGKRGITIWLTADQRRIPVKVETGVTVGSVTATLLEAKW
jgi:hypothetical protein